MGKNAVLMHAVAQKLQSCNLACNCSSVEQCWPCFFLWQMCDDQSTCFLLWTSVL